MKTFKHLLQLALVSFVVLASSCARDYNEPPLNEPVYDGPAANIKVAELKALYSTVTDPILIETDYILKGMVVANDISGNIFKQLYIQDETGGLSFGVDQNNVNTTYAAGQEVYVNLHGLSILKYGGEFQIGTKGTNANRIPWEFFKEHVTHHKWANPINAKPKKVDLASLTDDMVNTLVVLENIYFVNGGVNLFIKDATTATTEELIKDSKGNGVTLRTSSYASPFAGVVLPKGMGTITGVLGRHNGNWQFVVRDTDDIGTFTGEDPVVDPGNEAYVVNESFGDGADKIKVAVYTGWAMKAPIEYSDVSTNTDIRSLSGNSHAWFPANKDAYLTIKGIKTTGKSDLVLSFDIAANLFNAGESIDLNVMTVKINGVVQTIPSKVVNKDNEEHNKFFPVTFENFPIADDVTIEFFAPLTTNTKGLRIDNVKVGPKNTTIVPEPIP